MWISFENDERAKLIDEATYSSLFNQFESLLMQVESATSTAVLNRYQKMVDKFEQELQSTLEKYDEVSPCDHQYTQAEFVEGTCTAQGYAIIYCIYCGDTYYEYYGFGDHELDERGCCTHCDYCSHINLKMETLVEATCTATGEARVTCEVCSIEAIVSTPRVSHDLDENNNCVKRMMSSTNFAPATQTSCIGCHEHRTEAPIQKQKLPIAYRKGISKIQKIEGIERIVDYTRDIQPLINKYCVGCHNPKNPNGNGVILSMGIGAQHISPRLALQATGMCITDDNLLGDFAPYTFGSGGSKLARFAEGSHHNKKFSEKDINILKAWLDIGAPHISTYAAKGTCFPFKRMFRVNTSLVDRNAPMNKVFAKNCAKCHNNKNTKYGVPAKFVFDNCHLMNVQLKDGSVKKVTVGNVYPFKKDSVFTYDTKITIEYHTFKR
jgi:hypothetical protein